MFGTVFNLLTRFLPPRLPKLLTERPDLLMDHVLAYAALAKTEIELAKQEWIRRIVAGAIALAASLAFIVLAGVALMLNATAQPHAGMGWVLLAVPGSMLAIALVSLVVALSKGQPKPLSLSDQLKLDMQAFRTAMDAHS